MKPGGPRGTVASPLPTIYAPSGHRDNARVVRWLVLYHGIQMMELLRQRTVVQPGGIVEVRLQHVPPGTAVEVLVQPVAEETRRGTWPAGFRGKAKGVYSSPEDALRSVSSLRKEREL